MAKTQAIPDQETSTEEKIIVAARDLFIQKGYAGTRTRDIAEKAGINLALLNYYFRSKEKLFALIMTEKMELLFSAILPISDDATLSLEGKLDLLISNYFDLLLDHPDLPLFVLGEIKANPAAFREKIQVNTILKDSLLVQELRERNPKIEPVQFILSVLGLVIFPFISRQVLFTDLEAFQEAMAKRRKLVKGWLIDMIDNP